MSDARETLEQAADAGGILVHSWSLKDHAALVSAIREVLAENERQEATIDKADEHTKGLLAEVEDATRALSEMQEERGLPDKHTSWDEVTGAVTLIIEGLEAENERLNTGWSETNDALLDERLLVVELRAENERLRAVHETTCRDTSRVIEDRNARIEAALAEVQPKHHDNVYEKCLKRKVRKALKGKP